MIRYILNYNIEDIVIIFYINTTIVFIYYEKNKHVNNYYNISIEIVYTKLRKLRTSIMYY